MLKLKKRGALFFTVDAMMAGIVFTLTVIIVLSFFLNQPVTEDTKAYIDNYISYITNTRMEQYRTNYRYIYDDENESNLDMEVYKKIYLMNISNQNDVARSFVNNFTNAILPDNVGVVYMIDDYVLYNRSPINNDLIEASLSTSILTYFFDGQSIQGPSTTRITVWT